MLLCRNNVWEILYKISIFRPNHTTNMATIGNSCLWLSNLKKSSLKPFVQINWNLVGSIYGKFCINFPQSKRTDERHRLSLLILLISYPVIENFKWIVPLLRIHISERTTFSLSHRDCLIQVSLYSMSIVSHCNILQMLRWVSV